MKRVQVGMMKQAVPFVQRLLPLLDGQIGAAVANLLASRPHPPAPRVDLEPIEHRLADLQLQQHDLKDQLVDRECAAAPRRPDDGVGCFRHRAAGVDRKCARTQVQALVDDEGAALEAARRGHAVARGADEDVADRVVVDGALIPPGTYFLIQSGTDV